MGSPQENMQEKFEELNNKLKTSKPVLVLSELSMRSFCIGFYLPLIGSLSHLKDQTAAYNNISCLASVEHGKTFLINDHYSYETFAKGIERIVAPTFIEFTFNLRESTYSLGGIQMEDINVDFSVYFLKEIYELVYVKHGKEVIRYTKKYNEDIEPNEIYQLRDKICDYVFNKVTSNMEFILSKV